MKQRSLYQRNAVNWAKVILYINVKLSPPLKIPQFSPTAESSVAASHSSHPRRPSEHLDRVSDLSSHPKSDYLKRTKSPSPPKNNSSHKVVFSQNTSAAFWGCGVPGSAVWEIYLCLEVDRNTLCWLSGSLTNTIYVYIFKRMLWTQQKTLMNHSVMHQLHVPCSLIRWKKMTFHPKLMLSNVFFLMRTYGIVSFFNKGQLLDIWWKKCCVPRWCFRF